MTLVRTDLVFTRNQKFHLENLLILRFTHTENLQNEEEVLEALERAVTEWVETTPEGREAWEDSCEDFNIGDFCCQEDPQLQDCLKTHGIHSVETRFELVESQEISYDRILAHPELSVK